MPFNVITSGQTQGYQVSFFYPLIQIHFLSSRTFDSKATNKTNVCIPPCSQTPDMREINTRRTEQRQES